MNEKALSQLRVEPDIVVAVFLHDFGLDVLRTPASGALSETVLGLADQSSILLFCSVFRTLDYVRVRVVTEHETHLVVGPPVKLGGDRKVVTVQWGCAFLIASLARGEFLDHSDRLARGIDNKKNSCCTRKSAGRGDTNC
jgi:hypothetical protein